MVQSHETSLPIVDVGHPQLVLQGSETKTCLDLNMSRSPLIPPSQAKRSPYSWPDAVGLRPRAFRLMMTSLPLALLAFLPLVVEGEVALVRMVATSLLLVVASLVTNLLVFAISAAWARACNGLSARK